MMDDLFDDSLPEPPDHNEQPDPTHALSMRFVDLDEWGPRYPDCASQNQRRATGGGISVNIHKELAVLTAGLLAWTVDVAGYALDQTQTGGYVCRPIGGTDTPSNHSECTAIDLNWRENQFAYAPQFTIPMRVVEEWERWGWSWGGRWKGKKDTMHFEWNRSVAEARRRTALFTAIDVEWTEAANNLLNDILAELNGSATIPTHEF